MDVQTKSRPFCQFPLQSILGFMVVNQVLNGSKWHEPARVVSTKGRACSQPPVGKQRDMLQEA